MSDATRKYATIQHPTIEALVHHLYKYVNKKDALARFQHIRDNFVMSKNQPETTKDSPAAMFWIKGYAITPEEEAKGYVGQFCRMGLGVNTKGQHTLTAEKVEVPLPQHPQKKRLQSKHPNWGHPVMRAVKKEKVYPSLDAANAELDLLHLEFPEVTIPGVNKLFLIIYEKREGIKQPTRKIALEITEKDGGFVITHRDNEKGASVAAGRIADAHGEDAVPEALKKIQGATKEPARPVGGFTAQELVRKKKRAMKRKKSDPRTSKKIAVNPHTGE